MMSVNVNLQGGSINMGSRAKGLKLESTKTTIKYIVLLSLISCVYVTIVSGYLYRDLNLMIIKKQKDTSKLARI